MKKIILFTLLTIVFNSCASELKGFEFSNFENTPLSDLAKAVNDNDTESIRKIMTSKKLDIDYKEPVYQQTLLTLAIVNRKKEAFVELLNFGANPNILLGDKKNSTPFTESILNQKNCDLFYIENLLKKGANPNMEIIFEDKEHYFQNSYPLIVAIGQEDENGSECLKIIKLLVEYGADVNWCNPQTSDDFFCEGVIEMCLQLRNMESLRYFIIEKNVKIPKIAYKRGGFNNSAQRKYTLTEILNTEDYLFEDFEDEFGKQNLSRERQIRNEILQYLKKTGQK